jgi:hypothetical protein
MNEVDSLKTSIQELGEQPATLEEIK